MGKSTQIRTVTTTVTTRSPRKMPSLPVKEAVMIVLAVAISRSRK